MTDSSAAASTSDVSSAVRQTAFSLEGRIAQLLESGQNLVLLTIIHREGSSPRETGTHALLTDAGLEGTIGGGTVEAHAQEAAMACLASGISARTRFELAGLASPVSQDTVDYDGAVEVLCEAFTPTLAPLFALADAVLHGEDHGVWSIDITDDAMPRRTLHISTLPEAFAGLKDDSAVRVVDAESVISLLDLCKNRSGMLMVNDTIVYMEPLETPPVLLLCGGGHVSLEVAALAHRAGFVVDIADDRPEFADPARFPMARRCLALPGFENLVEVCGIGRRHFVVIVTRGHNFDKEALEQALNSHARYVGMIGSKAKREKIYAALRAQGIANAELAAVRCPIGLPIEAETPAQIAVAIVAELLAAKGGTLQRLRFED